MSGADPDGPQPPPPPARRRARYVAAAIVCGVVVVIAVVLVVVLADNVVYFRTVSEAVHDRRSLGTDRFRIAGAVVPGSVQQAATSTAFSITDGKHTVRIVHRGDLPTIFEQQAKRTRPETVPVVCEGHWGTGLTFDSDRMLIKHDADYDPPKVNTSNAPKVSQ
jgi:cytochrome c-type biogenesis protein CcmE